MKHIHKYYKKIWTEDQIRIVARMSAVVTALACVFFASVALFLVLSIHSFGLPFVAAHVPWYSVGLTVSMFLLSFAIIEYYHLIPSVRLLKIFVGLIFIELFFGFLLSKGLDHSQLRMGFLSSIYQSQDFPTTVSGVVTANPSTNSMIVKLNDGSVVKVYIPDEMKMFSKSVGDTISIAGLKRGNAMLAKAVNIF